MQAVARTAVPSRSCRASARPTGVATYAGVPLPGSGPPPTSTTSAALDFEALAAAVGRGSLALAVDAGDLAAVRDGLLAAGRRRRPPPVAVTGDGTGETQYTHRLHGGQLRAPPRSASPAGWCSTVGAGVAQRDKLAGGRTARCTAGRCWCPRTKEQAGAMSDRLRAYGAIPCEVPTIAVEPPRTPAQMERAIKGLVDGRYAWIVFTSVNAVRAVWEKFAEHGLDARHFGGVKIACIGEATADAVRALRHPARAGARRRAVLARACWPSSRRTTRSSTRSAGCCCRAPTSPPRPWPPG